jgi:rare lipoprotein A
MKTHILVLLVFFLTYTIIYGQDDRPLAKIYPDEYQGNLTYSGEIYDFDKLTAAHANLPLGTLIQVINPNNNKRVIVRVNDRISLFLPWKLLLSKTAGENLNITQTTPFEINLKVLKLGNPSTTLTAKGIVQNEWNIQKYPTEIKGNFGIQLGSFSEKETAIEFIQDLEVKGFTQIYLKEKNQHSNQYNVLIGPFEQYTVAQQTQIRLKSIFNLEGFVIPLN